jgi:type III secretion protein C
MRIAPKFSVRLTSACVMAFALLQASMNAMAIDLPTKQFVYKADSRKLPDVLQDFAASLEIPVIIADGVDGTVNGKFNLTPKSFLDLMSSAYGLTWYFDGNVLFLYPAKASQSKVIFLRDFGADRIERLLQTLKLGDKRFPLRYDPQEKTLLVSGPPRHLELVSSLVDALAERGREEGRRIVKVFPLKYASASDQTLAGSKVSGLVSMLNQIYGTGSKEGTSNTQVANAALTSLSPMQAIYGQGSEEAAMQQKFSDRTDKNIGALASTFSLGAAPGSGNKNATKSGPAQSGPAPEEDKPVFTADDANNAVVVMGLPHRMSSYADLIKQLDVMSDLIELEATIIDVRHDDAASIGVNWTAKNRSVELGFAPPPTLASASGSVFQLTTLSADLTKQLLVTVNALQQQGRARVVARPRVLGLANRTATMKDTRSVSVRVAGNLSSNLYSIETGTQIEVIPRKMLVDGVPAIKLALSIQDGSFDTAVVDAIPIVKRTEITTEAYVTEGEGLLIGGISSESNTSTQSGLPGLSQIPLLGNLFRSVDDQAERRERLFLITPRTISLARRSGQANRTSQAAPIVQLSQTVEQPSTQTVSQLVAPQSFQMSGGLTKGSRLSSPSTALKEGELK